MTAELPPHAEIVIICGGIVCCSLAYHLTKRGKRDGLLLGQTALQAPGGRVPGVETTLGPVTAERVVLCAGMWSRALAAPLGVILPLHAAEHMYIVTEPMPGVVPTTPVLRDYDVHLYAREDAG